MGAVGTALVAISCSSSASSAGESSGTSPDGGATATGGPRLRVATGRGVAGSDLANASAPAVFCAWEWAVGLATPRGIVGDTRDQVLVVARETNTSVMLGDDDGIAMVEECLDLATEAGLNHDILRHGRRDASRDTAVSRRAYTSIRAALGAPVSVASGLLAGDQMARALQLEVTSPGEPDAERDLRPGAVGARTDGLVLVTSDAGFSVVTLGREGT